MHISSKAQVSLGLTLLAALLLLDFYLITSVLAPRLENFATGKISSATGLECNIDGAYISFPFNLKLYNLALKDSSGQVLMSAGEILIKPKIFSLISGKRGIASVSSINSKDVLVRGIRRQDVWRFPEIKRGYNEQMPSAIGEKTLSIKAERLTIALLDDGYETQYSYETLTLKTDESSKSGRLTSKGETLDFNLKIGRAHV